VRIAILGNSGSGKSTLARWFAEESASAMLDLDTVAWVPEQIAIPRPAAEARADVETFCKSKDTWVIEGCYTSLIQVTLCFKPRLIFLNPGEELCVRNCVERPWESHKYQSKAQQDEHLCMLIAFAREYYTRKDDISLFTHRQCYDNYQGVKLELTERLPLNPADPELRACLK
jgi:adenylate kinase family enzyme